MSHRDQEGPPIPPPRPPLRIRPKAEAEPAPARPAAARTPGDPASLIPEHDRLEYVHQLLASGFAQTEILPHLARRFGCAAPAARRYLDRALSDLHRSAKLQTSFDGLQQVAMLRSLYRDCIRNQDFRAALDALKLLMRLSGSRLVEMDNGVPLHIEPEPPPPLPARRRPAMEVLDQDPPSGRRRTRR